MELLKDELRLNQYRLVTLISELACPAFQNIIRNRYKYLTGLEWSDGSPEAKVFLKNEIKYGHKELTKEEEIKRESGNLSEWDLTLLCKIIQKLHSLVLHKLFQDSYKSTTDSVWEDRSPEAVSFATNICTKILSQEALSHGKINLIKLGDTTRWDDAIFLKILQNNNTLTEESLQALNQLIQENESVKNVKDVRNYISHHYRILSCDFDTHWTLAEGSLLNLNVALEALERVKQIEIIKRLQFFDYPNSNFTGRTEELKKILSLLTKCSEVDRSREDLQENEHKFDEETVVIHGLGGVGKSELTREFLKQYGDHPIIQNVAWINAETTSSMTHSFTQIAHELCLKTEEVPIDEIVRKVYKHFSDHIDTGLFIFDNAQQMRGDDGIRNFLPVKSLANQPLVLITSRYKLWNVVPQNLIELKELKDVEAHLFLTKEFSRYAGVAGDAGIDGAKTEIRNLARRLHNYPLALNLAVSNINRKLRRKLVSTVTSDHLKSEIKEYIERISKLTDAWLNDQLGKESDNKYTRILNNVWDDTLVTIGTTEGVEGEVAILLLKLMAYLPTDEMTVETTNEIYESAEKNSVCTDEAFSILTEYSMINIKQRIYYAGKSGNQIVIHRLVQECTRGKLDRENDFTHLLAISNYLCAKEDYVVLYKIDEMMKCAHIYLHEREWPQDSIGLSIIFASILAPYKPRMDVWRAAFRILIQVNNFLGMNEKKISQVQLKEDFLDLFFISLFWLSYGTGVNYSNRIQNSELSEEKLERRFVSLVKPSISHALISKSGLSLAQKTCYKLCFQILNFTKEFQDSLHEEVQNIILDTVNQTNGCRFERAKQLYEILWRLCFFNPHHLNSNPILQTIVRKHFEIFTNLDPNSVTQKQLSEYWEVGGPFNFNYLKMVYGCNNFGKTNMISDWFFGKGGPEIITEYLTFLSQRNTNIAIKPPSICLTFLMILLALVSVLRN